MKSFFQFCEQLIAESDKFEIAPEFSKALDHFISLEKENDPMMYYLSENPSELEQYKRLYKTALYSFNRKEIREIEKLVSKGDMGTYYISYIFPRITKLYIESAFHLSEEIIEKIISDWENAYGKSREDL